MAQCEKYNMKITLLAEGSLSGSEREAAEAHIKGCPSCRAAYEETLALLGSLKGSHLPEPSRKYLDELAGKVYNELALRPKETQTHILRFRRLIAAAAVAAAVMIIFVSVSMFRQNQNVRTATNVLKPTITPAKPESKFAKVFTNEPSKQNTQIKTGTINSGNAVDTAAMQNPESEENLLSASFPDGNNDLNNVIESLSNDEAKDILESLDQSVSDDNS
jgi:hypothetical protein